MNGKVGIVNVGGGYRGIYAAGVLDYCMDHGISFDLALRRLYEKGYFGAKVVPFISAP